MADEGPAKLKLWDPARVQTVNSPAFGTLTQAYSLVMDSFHKGPERPLNGGNGPWGPYFCLRI